MCKIRERFESNEVNKAYDAWQTRVKDRVKRKTLNQLARLLVHYLTQDTPTFKGDQVGKIVDIMEETERLGTAPDSYLSRVDLMKILRELHTDFGEKVRKHIVAKHQREECLLGIWEMFANDDSPLWEQQSHDFLYEQELRRLEKKAARREQRAALKAARLALVKTLQVATTVKVERDNYAGT
jgi:hypothetical protein